MRNYFMNIRNNLVKYGSLSTNICEFGISGVDYELNKANYLFYYQNRKNV